MKRANVSLVTDRKGSLAGTLQALVFPALPTLSTQEGRVQWRRGVPAALGSPVAYDQSCLVQVGVGPPNLAYFWKPISLGMERGRMKRKAVRLMVNFRSVYQGLPPAPSGSFAITAITAQGGRRECHARLWQGFLPALLGLRTSICLIGPAARREDSQMYAGPRLDPREVFHALSLPCQDSQGQGEGMR